MDTSEHDEYMKKRGKLITCLRTIYIFVVLY